MITADAASTHTVPCIHEKLHSVDFSTLTHKQSSTRCLHWEKLEFDLQKWHITKKQLCSRFTTKPLFIQLCICAAIIFETISVVLSEISAGWECTF